MLLQTVNFSFGSALDEIDWRPTSTTRHSVSQQYPHGSCFDGQSTYKNLTWFPCWSPQPQFSVRRPFSSSLSTPALHRSAFFYATILDLNQNAFLHCLFCPRLRCYGFGRRRRPRRPRQSYQQRRFRGCQYPGPTVQQHPPQVR